jgi:ADP-ribose pyrophosphatase
MSGFSNQESMARYFDLLARQPELGRNAPDADIHILTDPQLVQQACDAAHVARAARNLDVSDLRVGVLASDPYMTMIRDAVRFGNGSLGLYNRIFENASVAVLPLIGDRPVVIRIFRHGLRQWSLEFPRGGVEPGETNEESARREVREEIGGNVLELIDTGEFTPGGSILAIRARLYVARIDQIRALDQAESIHEATAVTVHELEEMIRSGQIIDGFSISLFARARVLRLI